MTSVERGPGPGIDLRVSVRSSVGPDLCHRRLVDDGGRGVPGPRNVSICFARLGREDGGRGMSLKMTTGLSSSCSGHSARLLTVEGELADGILRPNSAYLLDIVY